MCHGKQCILFWSTCMKSEESLSQRQPLWLDMGIICHLSKARQKILTNSIFQSLLNHCSKKINGFQTFKVPDSIKNKTEQFPRAKKCPLLSWTSTKKKLPKESKLGHGNPGKGKKKKSLKFLPQIGYLRKLVFSYLIYIPFPEGMQPFIWFTYHFQKECRKDIRQWLI